MHQQCCSSMHVVLSSLSLVSITIKLPHSQRSPRLSNGRQLKTFYDGGFTLTRPGRLHMGTSLKNTLTISRVSAIVGGVSAQVDAPKSVSVVRAHCSIAPLFLWSLRCLSCPSQDAMCLAVSSGFSRQSSSSRQCPLLLLLLLPPLPPAFLQMHTPRTKRQ